MPTLFCGQCNRGAPFVGAYDPSRQCRWCWRYQNDLAFREAVDGRKVEDGPDLLTKARNLSSALADWAKAGFAVVDEETYEKRIAACLACPHYFQNTCLLCGCKVAGERLHKARLASSTCPDKPPRWEK